MKGAIFDVDGTILDSMTMWVGITNAFFREHGIDITPEQTLAYQCMSFEESLVKIHDEYLPQMSVEEMFAEFSRRADEAFINDVQPKDGACEYIKSLYDKGVKIAVATSGFPHLCRAAFKRIGILQYIDEFAFSSEVGCSKSKPDIYLLAAKRLGLRPMDCTVYEDIITGVMSAKSAGFKVIAIEDPTNAQDKDRLIQCSDRYITGWKELLSNI